MAQRHRSSRSRRLSPPATHDNRRAAQPEPEPDSFTLDDMFALLKDNLGKADAFITSAERQLEEAPTGDEEEDKRRRMHVEHLVESAKFAVRGAAYTAEEIYNRRSGA